MDALVRTLPEKARTITNPEHIYEHLADYHGIDPALASQRLHEIKPAAGLSGTDDVIFDRTGNVYDQSGLWIGSLTEGGAKRVK